jgi:hypothetical protein
MAGVPFIVLSAETVRMLDNVHVLATRLLVIENQTAFEAILRPPLRDDSTLYLFSGGHPGYAERELVATWMHAASELSWYVWTDWDLGGVRIQADWERWAEKQGLPKPKPWMWSRESLNRWCSLGQPLVKHEQADLLSLAHPLAEQLVEAGYTLEQEAVLPLLTKQDFVLGQSA